MTTVQEQKQSSQDLNKSRLSPRLEAMRLRIREGRHYRFRDRQTIDLRTECDAEHLSWPQRMARLTQRMCEAQTVIIEPDERIVFTRTVHRVPSVYTPEQRREVHPGPLWEVSNICADWKMLLSGGLLARKELAIATRRRMAADPVAVEFLDGAIVTIDAVLDLARRYADAARSMSRDDIADVLDRVPAHGASTFHEALQSLRLCQAVLNLSGHNQCGFGRFDQYLWPILQADLESGRLDIAAAEELLAEFFISLNKDADLYPGVQKGDNGQSLMLGGVRCDGTDGVNPLTWMALRVARATALIDPKINLRVDSRTDPALLELATELTRLGLGFPQYANDEVVIPGLVAAGYAIEDAREYCAAACWEFIIPAVAMEMVNIDALNMPAAADRAIRQGLAAGDTFDGILRRTRQEIFAGVQHIASVYRGIGLPPAPFYSVLMEGCLERGRDVSCGLKYNNFGIHGAGSANAADALAAVKTLVFDETRVQPRQLLDAMAANFAGNEDLQKLLREAAPKVGNDDPRVDSLLARLFNDFADACAAAGENGRGGRFRAGSGSAMFYVWLSRGLKGVFDALGATADGRAAGEYFSSSLAPSPCVAVAGPFSVLQSFSRIDYRRICNGGPITMELSDSVFTGRDAIAKVAMFIRAFVRSGCQQLQLNTLNVETLRDAQRHPELHKNLVVRVWGWSGYFVELDEVFQNQIIGRHVYSV